MCPRDGVSANTARRMEAEPLSGGRSRSDAETFAELEDYAFVMCYMIVFFVLNTLAEARRNLPFSVRARLYSKDWFIERRLIIFTEGSFTRLPSGEAFSTLYYLEIDT